MASNNLLWSMGLRCVREAKRHVSTKPRHHAPEQVNATLKSPRCPFASASASPLPREGLKEPPGPKSLPFIGTMYKYLPYVGSYDLTNRQATDTKKYQEFGPVVKEEVLPGQTFYYIFDPKLFTQVYQQEPKFPFRFEMTGVKEYRESRGHHPGFPNSMGEDWYKIRQATNKQTMRPQAVRAYIKRQYAVAKDTIDLMSMRRDEKGEVDDMLDIFYRWGMESVGVVIFDTRLGTLAPDLSPGSSGHQFVQAANEAFSTMYDTTFFWPLHKSKKTKTWRRLCTSFDYIADVSQKQIHDCLSRAKDGDIDDQNFLQLLSTKSNLTEDEVLSVICDLFYASVDSTAHALCFILYHLARNPDKQRILTAEILRHSSRQSGVTPTGLENMKYLKAVVKEALRLTPVSAFGVARTFDKDIEVAEYKIPAGATVFLQPNIAALTEEFFDEPESFKPERYLRHDTRSADSSPADTGSSSAAHGFPMMAFGYGSRICPGKRFAEQQIYLCLINIIQRYTVEYHYEPLEMATRFTNQPSKPLRIRFVDRR